MDNMGYTVSSGKSFQDISAALEKVVPEKNFRVLAVHDVKATLEEKGFEIKRCGFSKSVMRGSPTRP